MFNDSLTMAQQERLLKQLAKTALPFQCAHGRFARQLGICSFLLTCYRRPSLVPLTHLGNLSSSAPRPKGVDWARL